ncbi:hypothetical protein L6164_020995 [Bauhinia variegata]|uniref:Uncharacterized protein n=1 Tax=Bauhinia variegata TaxID=167791 RepID=A0ACB9MYU7_BAUVA|nr:hypothetical protein L6164_020995 [Bauhinia variegata]
MSFSSSSEKRRLIFMYSNIYVRRKSTIMEFMHNYDQALWEYRNNEMIVDFKRTFLEPIMTPSLYKIEHEAAKIYT